MTLNKTEELTWLLDKAEGDDSVCFLEHLTKYKEYASDEVHEWGREEDVEVRRLYRKLRDLLKIRLIENENLDKSIKLKHLSAFDGYVERAGVDVTSGGDKVESVVFYLPSNGRDNA